jgi:N-acetylneuraminate synthase
LSASIQIGASRVGRPNRCFLIAEAGVNHNGSVELAHRLVDAAADAGADAVKFQTFEPAALVTETAEKADYQRRNDAADTQLEMLAKLVLPREAHVELQRHAEARGIVFMSSPFDERSADFLDELGVPALKIASGEVTNSFLLRHVARKSRPLLMSTGMCTLDEVRAALELVRRAGDAPVALFHCVSSYPADAADANLAAMATMRAAFGVPVGWSDHTLGIDVAIAAVALGAELIEKHLTLDRTLPGPDHEASLEPQELAALVAGTRRVEAAIGDGRKLPRPCEAPIARVARKSLHYAAAFEAGRVLGAADLVALRPGDGVPVTSASEVLGRRLRRAVQSRTPLRLQDLEEAT